MPGFCGHPINHSRPKLLDRVWRSVRTRRAYDQWIKRLILFHNKQHPLTMSEKEINEFLTTWLHKQVKDNWVNLTIQGYGVLP